MPTPEELVTVVPADVAVILLVKAGLDSYRRAHRGEHWRTDQVLLAMTESALRWRDLADNGRKGAPITASVSSFGRMTTRQVADTTGVSARTIRRAIADGRLPAERAGRVWLIDWRDVGRYRRRET